MKKKEMKKRIMNLEAEYRNLEDRLLKIEDPIKWKVRHAEKDLMHGLAVQAFYPSTFHVEKEEK